MSKFQSHNAHKIVKKILETIPDARDDKQILYAHYLAEAGYNIFQTNVASLLQGITNKEIQSFDTISRRSREIQATNHELRGKKFLENRMIKEPEFINDLKN